MFTFAEFQVSALKEYKMTKSSGLWMRNDKNIKIYPILSNIYKPNTILNAVNPLCINAHINLQKIIQSMTLKK